MKSENTGKLHQEALDGLQDAWFSYFAELPQKIKYAKNKWSKETSQIDHDTPLPAEILRNPDHQVTQLFLYLFTIDSLLNFELNSGLREGDLSKIDTLGPFAMVFGQIMAEASNRRTDIPEIKELLEKKGTKLYRGTGLTKKQL